VAISVSVMAVPPIPLAAAAPDQKERINWVGLRHCRKHAPNCGRTHRARPGRTHWLRHWAVEALLQAKRTVPIVFVNVADPVGAGFVESLARPGGNATGFLTIEYSVSAKWVELLKQIAPSVTRAAVLRDPATTGGIGQFAVVQSVAPSVGIDVSPIDVWEADAIERALTAFA